VKFEDVKPGCAEPVARTRESVARLILELGPQTAAALATQLSLSPAAIRRHLDALVGDGLLIECDSRRPVRRGRGRPARTYSLTEDGRNAFPHAYDDLANTALRYLRDTGGDAMVTAFAEHRAAQIEAVIAPVIGGPDRALALAGALTTQGYAATTERAGAGVQICQHHCPVAHVAAEFPELCEAETRAFERVLGTYVQRLATIAHGDGVCTTHIPDPPVRSELSVKAAPAQAGRTA
jgi:predicted ArsR family transcriptional regulator